MNEQEQFLKDVEPQAEDLLEQPLTPEKEEEVPEKPEDDEMKLRNRREKRLARDLQAEREAGIKMAAQLAVYSETAKFKQEAGDDYLKSVDKIYGSETPEAVAATELLKSALKGVGEKATERALERFREEQSKAQEAVKNEEKQLDSMIEEIEDDNNLILTADQKKGFFSLLERMSPKDTAGNVIHYADPNAVWEVYQSKSKKIENRAKDLSSRSMVQSGASKDSQLEDDATARYLKEQGII